jgi:hypothetical protein
VIWRVGNVEFPDLGCGEHAIPVFGVCGGCVARGCIPRGCAPRGCARKCTRGACARTRRVRAGDSRERFARGGCVRRVRAADARGGCAQRCARRCARCLQKTARVSPLVIFGGGNILGCHFRLQLLTAGHGLGGCAFLCTAPCNRTTPRRRVFISRCCALFCTTPLHKFRTLFGYIYILAFGEGILDTRVPRARRPPRRGGGHVAVELEVSGGSAGGARGGSARSEKTANTRGAKL